MKYTYLPEIGDDELKAKLLSPDSGFLVGLGADNHERTGLDRALLIAADIALRTGKCDGFSILDAGCNNGLIGRALAVLGNTAHGIDSGVIEGQQRYDALSNVEKADIYDYLMESTGQWDFILLLSVAHHWEAGYAGNGRPIYREEQIHRVFERMRERARVGIYMEMPLEEPGFDITYTDGFMKKYCSGFNIIEINRTVATNGFQRRLYYLDIAGINRNPVAELILRNAHLYEKLEMSRLSVPRAEAFELRQKIEQLEKGN